MNTMISEPKIEFLPTRDIPGLTLRNFRDSGDFGAMAKLLDTSRTADGIEETRTANDLATFYTEVKHFDLERDLFFVEYEDELVAYAGTRWREETGKNFVHVIWEEVHPDWRGRGIEAGLLQLVEARTRIKTDGHSPQGAKWLRAFVPHEQDWLKELLTLNGYEPVRVFYDMVRPNLENIPSLPLPPGIEVRPVKPEDYNKIWMALVEAFGEHWGEEVHDESDYEFWLKFPHFNPALWQVAWEGDEVVGTVLNFVDGEADAKYKRKRGYTEDISVRKPWRGRGIAKALLARSLKMFRDMGFDSTTLGVDAENATGALRLYENMGYETVRTFFAYRKAM